MKKVYNILSLLLLSIIGVNSAVAQSYDQGDLLTSTDEIVGQQVVLYFPGTSFDPGYMCGTQKSTTITSECVYEFEATGGQADGYDLYYLKQVSTGKYLADFDDTASDPEPSLAYTSDKSEAIALTVLPFDDDVTDKWTTENNNKDCSYLTRTSYSMACQEGGTQGFVLCRGAMYSSNIDSYYAGNCVYIVGYMAYAPYPDTNIWCIYALKEKEGYDKLQAYVDEYLAGGDFSSTYPSGTGPGYYDATVVSEAETVYEEAYTLLVKSQSDVTNEEYEAMCDKVLAVYEKLESSRIPLSDGYYFIYTDSRYLSTATKSEQEFLWTVDGYTVPSPLDVAAVKQIWQVTKAENEDQYNVKNMYSNKYINGTLISCSSYGVSTDDGKAFILGDENPVNITLTGTASPASWIISNSSNQQLHAKFSNGAVMTWNEEGNVNNCFHFSPVSEEDLNEVLGSVEQVTKNEELQALYDKALAAYNSGTAYTPLYLDEDFSQADGLLTSESQVFSTCTETSEGSLAGLVDRASDTYWHSVWSSTSPNGIAHYIGVDLLEAVSGNLQFKMARRQNNPKCYPMTVNFYGSNEVDTTDPDAATWNFISLASVDWETITDGTLTGGVGFATVNVPTAYRYFKMELASNEKTDSESHLMALAELQVYPNAVIDEANSTLSQVSEATRTEIETQLAAARTELDNEKATDATIAALQAAYDKFVTELPVPSQLTDAIEEAQAIADNANINGLVGDQIGYYATDGYNTLTAAIDAANAFDTNNKTATEINAEVAKLEAALESFYASVILPEAGKYYVIRGRSEKVYNNQLTSYNALVYSKNNGIEEAVWFTRPDGAKIDGATSFSEFDVTSLVDTVSAEEDLKYLWKVEKAEAGKLVVRNVGTGMYLAPADGEPTQGTAASEISVTLGKAGVFVLDAGGDKQLNARSDGFVTTWADATDQNAWWTFEEVNNDNLSDTNYARWEVTPGVYQIITLPYEIDAIIDDGTAYKLVGEAEDGKFVIAEENDVIPAATPFIFKANDKIENNLATFYMTYEDVSTGTLPTYCYEPVHVAGIQGTLCEEIEATTGGMFSNKGIVVTAVGKTIGVNSGYFDGTQETGVSENDGDDTIATAITEANTIILPSIVNVYSINGALLRQGVKATNATQGLPAGVYVVGGVKMIIK